MAMQTFPEPTLNSPGLEPPPAPPIATPAAAPAPTPSLGDDRDLLVRTISAEHDPANPLSDQSIASVALNRAQKANATVGQVVLEHGQFEPWSNPKTRARMLGLQPDSPTYQTILANIQPLLSGAQQPLPYDSFYSPGAQAVLAKKDGRPVTPSWDDGSGVKVGSQLFFTGKYVPHHNLPSADDVQNAAGAHYAAADDAPMPSAADILSGYGDPHHAISLPTPAAAAPAPAQPAPSDPNRPILPGAYGLVPMAPPITGPSKVDRRSPSYQAAYWYFNKKAWDQAVSDPGGYEKSLANLQVSQGITGNFIDEMKGGVASLGPPVSNALASVGLGKGLGFTSDDAYQAMTDLTRQQVALYQSRHPLRAGGLTTFGATLPWIAADGALATTKLAAAPEAVGALAQNAKTITTMAKIGGAGAAQGYVSGLGQGEGDFQQRAPQAGREALAQGGVSALTGPVVEALAPAAEAMAKTGGAAYDATAGKVATAADRVLPGGAGAGGAGAAGAAAKANPSTLAAQDSIYSLMKNQGVTPADLAAKGASPAAAPLTTAEALSYPGMGALKDAAERSGPAVAADVGSQLEARTAGTNDRVLGALKDASGISPELARGDIEAHIDAQKNGPASDAWKAAMEPRPVMTPALSQALSEEHIGSVFGTAKRAVEATGEQATMPGFAIDPDTASPVLDQYTHQPVIEQQPTPRTVDKMRRLLNHSVARDDYGNLPSGADAPANQDRLLAAERFTGIAKEATPGLDEALDQSGNYLRMRTAFKNGGQSMAPGVEAADHARLYQALTNDNDKKAFAAGMLNDIRNTAARDAAGSALTKRLSDQNVQTKLGAVLPADRFAGFTKALGRESEMANSAALMKPRVKLPTEEQATAPAAAAGHKEGALGFLGTLEVAHHVLSAVPVVGHALSGAAGPVILGAKLTLKAAKTLAKVVAKEGAALTPAARAEFIRILRQNPRATAEEMSRVMLRLDARRANAEAARRAGLVAGASTGALARREVSLSDYDPRPPAPIGGALAGVGAGGV